MCASADGRLVLPCRPLASPDLSRPAADAMGLEIQLKF